MSGLKRLYFLIVLAAALWSAVIVVTSLFTDEKLLFIPLQEAHSETTIAQRGEVLRLSFFLLFVYFSVLHIFAENRKISAGHVLLSIMTSLTIIGGIKLVTLDSFANEAAYVVIFALSSVLIFLGSRPSVRHYFKKRA